ncbi:hypothetical protein VOLCADRAFT_95760 [Volvox carteri f. nagariensis]|uniref:GRIP domain-containing protein n=1 Tax=Volvox carteri f. nagariensis TaxID=3068 RepID=D8U8B3_VOLCA|nr:uncharacterized protein VOLCADRAFT_95760 [Volvox carteri f. nagariensis]EFJ44059.1 hypothetical protein VOLCADRAFT_95760 [Volvox carteri f. nagariensis]|eukprot:XP_002954860.1 hypothetical protein VOLCADRAFT_95760 [Volvox carteri f. nagariensis]
MEGGREGGRPAELVAAQSCISRLEAALQLAQQREAASSAALVEAEAVARRSDELAMANLQLSQRLAESKAEMEMAAYYKKASGVCGELTEAKSRLEEQLMGLGSLLSASELRLADMAARAAAADVGGRGAVGSGEHAALAECRARAAESSIASEVERRCGAVLSSRALWPPALREEVEALEARLAAAEAERGMAVQRAEAAARAEGELREQLGTKTAELALLTQESAAAATAFAAQLQQLREALAESQARVAGLPDDLSRSRAREEASATIAAAVAAPRRHSNGGNAATAPSPPTATAVMTPKWQVQNRVGGGGLYNLDAAFAGDPGDGGNSSGGGDGSGSAGTRKGSGGPSNVDAVYMKNVLFKFLEAHLTNKVQERDMLLPAVATLLQVGRWVVLVP